MNNISLLVVVMTTIPTILLYYTFDKLEVGRDNSWNPAVSGLTAAVTDSSCLYNTT